MRRCNVKGPDNPHLISETKRLLNEVMDSPYLRRNARSWLETGIVPYVENGTLHPGKWASLNDSLKSLKAEIKNEEANKRSSSFRDRAQADGAPSSGNNVVWNAPQRHDPPNRQQRLDAAYEELSKISDPTEEESGMKDYFERFASTMGYSCPSSMPDFRRQWLDGEIAKAERLVAQRKTAISPAKESAPPVDVPALIEKIPGLLALADGQKISSYVNALNEHHRKLTRTQNLSPVELEKISASIQKMEDKLTGKVPMKKEEPAKKANGPHWGEQPSIDMHDVYPDFGWDRGTRIIRPREQRVIGENRRETLETFPAIVERREPKEAPVQGTYAERTTALLRKINGLIGTSALFSEEKKILGDIEADIKMGTVGMRLVEFEQSVKRIGTAVSGRKGHEKVFADFVAITSNLREYAVTGGEMSVYKQYAKKISDGTMDSMDWDSLNHFMDSNRRKKGDTAWLKMAETSGLRLADETPEVEGRGMRPEIALKRIERLKTAIECLNPDKTSEAEDLATGMAYGKLCDLALDIMNGRAGTTRKITERFLNYEKAALPVLQRHEIKYVPFSTPAQSAMTVGELNQKIVKLRSAIMKSDYIGGTVDDDSAFQTALFDLAGISPRTRDIPSLAAKPENIRRFLEIEASVKDRFFLYGASYEPVQNPGYSMTSGKEMEISQQESSNAPLLNDGALVHNKLFLVGRIEKLQETFADVNWSTAGEKEKATMPAVIQTLDELRTMLSGDFQHNLLPDVVALYNQLETQVQGAMAAPVASIVNEIHHNRPDAGEVMQMAGISMRAEKGALLPSDMHTLQRIRSDVLAREKSV